MTFTACTDQVPTDARVSRLFLSNSEVEETLPMDWASDAGEAELTALEDSFALAFDAYVDSLYDPDYKGH